MPEAFARGLFDKFFRIKRGTSHGREGVGLGLALCKAVVDAHGGRIGFTNAPPLTPARCFYTGNCCIRCGDLSMARKRSICGH
ncbi:MAG: ATP-binding protein [Dehalococcoidia bacterium]